MVVLSIFLLIIANVIYQCIVTRNSLTVNTGANISASDYLRFKSRKAKFTKPEEFDINKPGEYKVHVRVGLKRHKVKLIVEDHEKPVINGARDMIAYVGGSIAYRSFITYTDNAGADNVKLDIDSSAVDLNTAGKYTVTCTATDAAGNKATATFPVEVVEQTYTEEELFKECDKILKSIIKDNMTKAEQVEQIYLYVRHHMSFVNTSEKGDWIKAAMTGIKEKSGDCYVYACYTRALLTKAGIKCMEIKRIPTDNGVHSNHYWNLVDVEDGHGWYHTDPCPRHDGNPKIIMWTDAELMEYSKAHDNCYNYDKSIYPKIP